MAALIAFMNIHTINKDRQIRNIFGLIGSNKFDNTWDVSKTFFTDQMVPIYFKKLKKSSNEYLLLLHSNHKRSICDQSFELNICSYSDPYNIGRKPAHNYECLIQNLNIEKQEHVDMLKKYKLL
jgi:hypothetical protein